MKLSLLYMKIWFQTSCKGQIFTFDPVSSSEVDMEILATPSNKVYGLYSCPVHLLKSVRHSLSPLLAALMNKSSQPVFIPIF